MSDREDNAMPDPLWRVEYTIVADVRAPSSVAAMEEFRRLLGLPTDSDLTGAQVRDVRVLLLDESRTPPQPEYW
jgi:hypothetical protein